MTPSPRPYAPLPHVFALMALCALAGLLYAGTMDVPLHFDDHEYVASNPLVKDISRAFGPPSALPPNVASTTRTRFLGYLSLWANHRLHGTGVGGYHVVNTAIHAGAGMLVYWLALLMLEAWEGRRRPSGEADPGRWIALATACIFVAHPINTQAVAYISQRFESMAAMFYLGAVCCYLRWRLGGGWAVYALGILSALAAMHTKETAFTIPVMLAALEALLFSGPARTRLMGLLPWLLMLGLIPLYVKGDASSMSMVAGGGGHALEITRLEYALTQVMVVVTYLRLLALPINQNLDYGYPLWDGSPGAGFFLAAAVLALMAYLVVLGSVRTVRGRAGLADVMVALGGAWFLVALSVTSSVVPLGDVMFEHRAYMASVGPILAGVALMGEGMRRVGVPRWGRFALAILVLSILCAGTFARLRAWGSEAALWEDTVRKSPGKARPYNELGTVYALSGELGKAERILRQGLDVDDDYVRTYVNLGNVYVMQGRYREAAPLYRRALQIRPGLTEAANGLNLALRNQ